MAKTLQEVAEMCARAQREPSMVLAGPESQEKAGTGTNIPTKEIKPVQAKIWSQYRAENAFL